MRRPARRAAQIRSKPTPAQGHSSGTAAAGGAAGRTGPSAGSAAPAGPSQSRRNRTAKHAPLRRAPQNSASVPCTSPPSGDVMDVTTDLDRNTE